MQEELSEIRELIEEWGKIPLAAEYSGDLCLLDDQLNEWYAKLEKALKSVELAVDRLINT